jgi:hypothetical protein
MIGQDGRRCGQNRLIAGEEVRNHTIAKQQPRTLSFSTQLRQRSAIYLRVEKFESHKVDDDQSDVILLVDGRGSPLCEFGEQLL